MLSREHTSTNTDLSSRTNGLRHQLEGLQLLVVDDDADVRELLATLISDQGGTVTEADSVADALHAFDSRHFDIVLSDLAMPEHDGYDLIAAIRRDDRPEVHHIRAIAVTAHADDAHRRRAVAAGFDAYLTKPVDPARLVATIVTVTRPRE